MSVRYLYSPYGEYNLSYENTLYIIHILLIYTITMYISYSIANQGGGWRVRAWGPDIPVLCSTKHYNIITLYIPLKRYYKVQADTSILAL